MPVRTILPAMWRAERVLGAVAGRGDASKLGWRRKREEKGEEDLDAANAQKLLFALVLLFLLCSRVTPR